MQHRKRHDVSLKKKDGRLSLLYSSETRCIVPMNILPRLLLEVCDGLFIHQLIGKLKEGDIPADMRVKCVDVIIENYFPKDRVIQKGYPLEMRYAGPREALLHAIFRQNYGATHLIVGRDHAGVGEYYGPFDAQRDLR